MYFYPTYRKDLNYTKVSSPIIHQPIKSKLNNKILICIFNYRHDENTKFWKSLLSPYFETVVLDSGNDHIEKDFIQFPNIYYSGLFNEAKKLFEKDNYQYIGIITSDVQINQENANKLIKELYNLLYAKNIGCWTILGDLNGHSNRFVYAKYNNHYYRTFEGFFIFIKNEVFANQPHVDLEINKYGYGLDFLSCYISNRLGFANIVNEDIYIYHPKDKGYNGNDATHDSILYQAYIRKNFYPDYFVKATEFNHKINKYEIKPQYMKKAIYTCISGNYDTLREPTYITDGWDYICFTDLAIKSSVWQIKTIPEELNYLSQVKCQRIIKILSDRYLPEYDIVIWADANCIIKGNLDEFCFSVLKENNIAFKQHPSRNCIYDEFNACIYYQKETTQNCNKLKERYLSEGFPKQFGLFETNVYIKNNRDEQVSKLMQIWADELIANFHRDQLSLNYCIWKLNMKESIDVFSNSEFNKYFTLTNHKPNHKPNH